jgi:hypothetical protein
LHGVAFADKAPPAGLFVVDAHPSSFGRNAPYAAGRNRAECNPMPGSRSEALMKRIWLRLTVLAGVIANVSLARPARSGFYMPPHFTSLAEADDLEVHGIDDGRLNEFYFTYNLIYVRWGLARIGLAGSNALIPTIAAI